MWICKTCKRKFQRANQTHYCGNKSIDDFLLGKSEIALELFHAAIERFKEIGPINLYATKSMIVISADIRFAYITNIGKNFVDCVLPFEEPYHDNLCFRKIAIVPGDHVYNHHLRLMHVDDLNEEVIGYFEKAYENGKTI